MARTQLIWRLLLGFAVLGIAVTGLLHYGLRLRPSEDRAHHAAAAYNIAEGHGLTDMHGPFTIAPPGVSLLASPLVRLGLAPERAVQAVDLASYFTLCALVWWMARRWMGDAAAWTSLAALLLIPHLWASATAGLTEMPFTLALTLFAAYAMASPRRGPRAALLMGVLIALAVSLRYVGLFLIPVTVLMACIRQFSGDRKGALTMLGAALAAMLLVAPIFARNEALTGTLTGGYGSSSVGLWTNATRTGWGIIGLVAPNKVTESLRGPADWLGIVVVIPMAFAIAVGATRRQQWYTGLSLVTLVYLGTLALMGTLLAVDTNQPRFAVPLTPWLAATLPLVWSEVSRRAASRRLPDFEQGRLRPMGG